MQKKAPRTSQKKTAMDDAPNGAELLAQEGVDRYIAGQLKAMYDQAAAEPIPDRLLQLLNRLDDGKS
jgi:Anti-sigma factor NepR